MSNAMICRIKQKSFQFLFEKLGVRDQSNVNGQAVPRSWCSDGERPLWWDPSRTRNNQIVPPSWAERGASWDVGYGGNQLDQIRRCTTIDSMVYQKAEFELNSLCNWQPVKFIHRRWHVFQFWMLYYIFWLLYSVLDLSGVGGLTLLWCLSTPQVCIDPRKIVKISQKYIADPSLVFPQIEYWLYSLAVNFETGYNHVASDLPQWQCRDPNKFFFGIPTASATPDPDHLREYFCAKVLSVLTPSPPPPPPENHPKHIFTKIMHQIYPFPDMCSPRIQSLEFTLVEHRFLLQ